MHENLNILKNTENNILEKMELPARSPDMNLTELRHVPARVINTIMLGESGKMGVEG